LRQQSQSLRDVPLESSVPHHLTEQRAE